jgi:hypothetical protein
VAAHAKTTHPSLTLLRAWSACHVFRPWKQHHLGYSGRKVGDRVPKEVRRTWWINEAKETQHAQGSVYVDTAKAAGHQWKYEWHQRKLQRVIAIQALLNQGRKVEIVRIVHEETEERERVTKQTPGVAKEEGRWAKIEKVAIVKVVQRETDEGEKGVASKKGEAELVEALEIENGKRTKR